MKELPLVFTNWRQEAISFIQDWDWTFSWEGYTDTCKPDNKQNSRWHGTKCYEVWSKVTKDKADEQFHSHLNPLYELVDSSCYNDNQKIAIVSYMYNTWGNQMNLKTHLKQCNYKDIRYIMSIWWWNKEYPWLKIRRTSELSLFNKI